MITYMVENATQEVIGYSRTLSDAKDIALSYISSLPENAIYSIANITKMVGPYFGEGGHQYVLQVRKDKKFKYIYKR